MLAAQQAHATAIATLTASVGAAQAEAAAAEARALAAEAATRQAVERQYETGRTLSRVRARLCAWCKLHQDVYD